VPTVLRLPVATEPELVLLPEFSVPVEAILRPLTGLVPGVVLLMPLLVVPTLRPLKAFAFPALAIRLFSMV
jgi:hypothetical protein